MNRNGRSGGPQNASDLFPSASRRVACHALNRRCSRGSSRKTDCKCPQRLGVAETRGAFVIRGRVGALKGAEAARRLSERWGRLEASGLAAALEAERGRLLARMHDVSEFVKTFKEEFDRAFKRGRPYCGSVWSGRFASTLVEGGEYLRRCVKYVLHNPVRAGLVSQAKDYAWSWCAPDMLPGAGTGPMSGPAPVGTGPADEGKGRLAEAGAAGTGAGPVAGADAARAGGDAGTGPGGWWLRRVAQVGAGKVFGSAGFVLRG